MRFTKRHVLVVLPVYNEEGILEQSFLKLYGFLEKNMSDWGIIIANNASTDRTLEIAKSLAGRYENCDCVDLPEKGRGRALKKAWSEHDADIYSYMDIDLATDLMYLPKLVSTIEKGADIAIGSRLADGSRTDRPIKRELLSRGYNLLLRLLLDTGVKDVQCGFKAVSGRTARELVPLVQNMQWFFDTELLVLAKKNGLKIEEIPVAWSENLLRSSKVNLASTTLDYLKLSLKLKRRLDKANCGT